MLFAAKRALIKALREPEARASGLPLDLALLELNRATSRDQILLALLRGAAFWLRDVQIFLTRAGLLCGYVSLSHGRVERKVIRGRALDILASAAVERTLRTDRGAMVIVSEDDPIGHLANHRQLVVQPVCLDARPVCLVVGPPRDNRPRRCEQLLRAMERLADGAAEGLHRVILQRRVQTGELEIVALPPPRTLPKAPAELRETGAQDRVARIIPIPRREDPEAPPQAPFRFPRSVDVGPTSLDNFYTGLDGSIFQAGIFVATHAPRRVGDRVEVTFTVPQLMGAQTIIGPVHWVQQYDPNRHCEHSVPGMGIKLSAAELSVGVRTAIERFIKQRPPLLFE